MNMTTQKKIVIVGVLAFILGIAITQIPHGNKGYGMEKRGDMQKSARMMQHRMPDGSMMDGSMKGGMENMMNGMVVNMQGKTGKDLEKAFLTDMIPHHQGAVEMAKLLVADATVSAELRAFAQQIITAQEGEIEKMGVWMKND